MNNETVFLSCSFSDCAYINFNGTANIANLTTRLRSMWQNMVYFIRP